MEKISKYQLSAMIILFEIGSSPLFTLGIDAGRDAWLVIIGAMIASSLLLVLFLSIQLREPDKHLFQLFNKYFGSLFGKLAGLAYVLYFIYEGMRNVRDFGDLTIMTFLSRTPIWFIMLIMVLLSSYAVYKGLEVFFRAGEFMLPGVLLFYSFLIVMYFVSGIVHLDRLLPVLENGIMPVIKAIFKDPFWFPFGQMVLFLVYWSHLSEKEDMVKVTFSGYLTVGVLLLLINIINICVLGVPYAKISTAPLLQSVQLIQAAEILERFDAFVILLVYVGIFIKVTMWHLAASLGLGHLFNIDYRRLVFPIGVVIYLLSFLPPNWTYHIWLGRVSAYNYWVNPIFIAIAPLLLFAAMLLKGSGNTSR